MFLWKVLVILWHKWPSGPSAFNKLYRAAATICLHPCKLTISSYLFARWYLFRHVDLWPFELESGVRVTCDVGYLCANFSLPRPLCSRVTPDVRDRQTDVRQKHRLMPPPYEGGCIITACRVIDNALDRLIQCTRLSTVTAERRLAKYRRYRAYDFYADIHTQFITEYSRSCTSAFVSRTAHTGLERRPVYTTL